MEFAERTREVELVGKAKLLADSFYGQIRAVEKLHGALHPQVVQVHQRGVTGHTMEDVRVMGAGEIHHRGERGNSQRFLQMCLHETNALGNALFYVVLSTPEFILVAKNDAHQMS